MVALETIKEMQKQGLNDEQVTQNLQEQGYSPNEINEGLSQSKIKNAIFDKGQQPTSSQQIQSRGGMQPSMLQSPQTSSRTALAQSSIPKDRVDASSYNKAQDEMHAQEYQPQLPPRYQNREQVSAPIYNQEAEVYQEPYAENYDAGYGESGGGYGYQTAGVSPEIVNEIAEQVVAEKMSDMIKTMTNLVEFKTRMDVKIENINTRLERAETALDQLQSAVIRKVGSYVQDVQDIKTEMRLMQGSFSKALPGMAKKSAKTTKNKTKRKPKKKK